MIIANFIREFSFFFFLMTKFQLDQLKERVKNIAMVVKQRFLSGTHLIRVNFEFLIFVRFYVIC